MAMATIPPAEANNGDGVGGGCSCCSGPPTCPTCSKTVVKVVVENALTGVIMCKVYMGRGQTIKDLMGQISSITGTRKVMQLLMLKGTQENIVINNKFMPLYELTAPGSSKLRLLLVVESPPLCCWCKKKEGAKNEDTSIVRLKFCAGCYSAAYCCVECEERDWRVHHKTTCSRRP